MPLDIGALRKEGVQALVTWRGEDILVRYLPTKHTSEMQDRMEAAIATKDGSVIDLILGEIVTGWDITDGTDPYPYTPENVTALPMMLRIAIVEGVVADLANPTIGATSRGAPAPTATSSSGSPPAAPSDAPSGPSASPSGSA